MRRYIVAPVAVEIGPLVGLREMAILLERPVESRGGERK
jgi:hypothetical protein